MNEFFSVVSREAVRILYFILGAFAHTWPLWVVSIPLAAAVRASSAATRLNRIISMRPLAAVIAATLFGAFSPFCSCSVVPVVFSLLVAGVPLAPVMAFWLASPSMDPEIFFMSVSAVGWPLAVARLAAATLMSFGGGLVTMALERRGWFKGGILRDKTIPAETSCCARSAPSVVSVGGSMLSVSPVRAACCASAVSAPSIVADSTVFTARPRAAAGFRRRFGGELVSSILFVAKFMAVAFLLEALITFYLPESWIRAALGAENAFSVPIAVLVGIPFYTTNAQALGLVSGLLGKGMGEGAALAFLISGATTTLPAMSAVFGIARPRVFIVYLGSAIIASAAAGFIWSLL